MPDISTLSPLSNDSTLTSGATITHTEHNTHRTNYRTLINNLLIVVADLENNYSSASEPGDTPDGKLWYDSGNTKFQARVSSAWADVFHAGLDFDNVTGNFTTGGKIILDVDGTAVDADGSVTFGAGNDTGIFWNGANTVFEVLSTQTNSVQHFVFKHQTSGTPANNIGVGIAFQQETSSGNVESTGLIDCVTSDVTSTSEDAQFEFYLQVAGASASANKISTLDSTGLDLETGLAYQIAGTSVLNATTLGSGVVTSSLTTVGALNSGSITSGFGSIDIGSSALSTTGTITGPSGTWDAGGMDLATSDTYAIAGTDVLNATTLGSGVVTSSLTTVGALNSGSITSGFGAIDNGASNITTTGQISGGTLTDGTASLTSGAWTGVTTITVGNTGLIVGSSTPFSDAAGTLTLQNIDAIDATTESTIETAIDTLSNLTTVGALNSGSITSGFGTIDNGSSTITTTGTVSTGAIRSSSGSIATGGETSPDVDAGGACLNHGANDGNVLTFKNSDVAHGITSILETDTYAKLGKYDANSGGLSITTASEAAIGYGVFSYATTEVTTDTGATGDRGTIVFSGKLKSGTSDTNLSSNANMFTIDNNGTVRLILKGNGDMHITNTTLTALDEEDDIGLARNLQLALGGERYKHRVSEEDFNKLVDLKAISSDGEFQIMQGCTAVTLGAISQLFNALKKICTDKLDMSEQELIEYAQTY